MPADNVILGNYIGTDVTGKKALPNATDGVMDIGYPSEDTIGGTVAGAGNIIAFNGGAAVNAEDAFIQQNSIFANGSGINSAYRRPCSRRPVPAPALAARRYRGLAMRGPRSSFSPTPRGTHLVKARRTFI